MAERGTFIGELERGWHRFWGLRWRWKGSVLAILALIVIGAIGNAGGGAKKSPAAAVAAAGSPGASHSSAAPTAPRATNTPAVTNTPAITNTPAATATPKPTATPRPPTPTPLPAGYSFGSGQKLVGSEVIAGATYRTRKASSGCYWERDSGLGGTFGEIAANDNTDGPAVVTIGVADKAFSSERCGTWTRDLSAITSSPMAPFQAGTFIVGTDIAAGIWRSDGSGSCYWQRDASFTGNLGDIIANNNVDGPATVQLSATDKGFTSAGCGTWRKIG